MKRCYLLAIIALLCAQTALAQTFSVKGVLRDPLGRTVEDGSYKLTLRLYSQETGGSEIWSEIHGSVQAQHGVVSVELGSVESLATVGFGETYWLGIQVEDHAEMEPRIKLGTNPYSLAVKGKDHVFPSTGNVGVNTLAPTELLEVNGNAKVIGALIFADGSSMSSADLGGTASSLLNPSTTLVTADSDDDGTGQIEFKTGTSTDLVIDNSGSVGIGTATPGSKLDVAGDVPAGTPLVRLGDHNYGAETVLSVAPGSVSFDKHGEPGGALYIDGTTGSVGIGTATPASELDVAGDVTARFINSLAHEGRTTTSPAMPYIDFSNDPTSDFDVRLILKDEENFKLEASSGKVVRLGVVGGAAIGSNYGTLYPSHNGLYVEGHVGIGTVTPGQPLTVMGHAATGFGPFTMYPANSWSANGHPSLAVSIYAGDKVAASEFVAFSDARIKNVIGISDGRQDLEIMRGLQITDYTYVDVVGKGTQTNKKVVAQQVQEVYPQAVIKSADFVPSVYRMSSGTAFEEGVLRVTTEKQHGFTVADTVRLIFEEGGRQQRVVRSVIDEHTFAVDQEEAVERVFVWGKQVQDFLSVDYEAIAMLNVSATQELARRVEALEKDNAALQAQLDRSRALEAENAMLKVRMERFEAALQRLEVQQTELQRVEEVVVEDSGLSLAD